MLKTEQDFYDLMYAYLKTASINNVFVAEIFFDPQTHTERGIPFDFVINGLQRALVDGYMDFGIKGSLIMCFLRHLSEDSAIAILKQAEPHLDKILGVGLDSGEVGNPPSKFERVYKMAAALGLKLVAHAGEEMGPSYIEEALDLLHVARIDHGVRCLEDPKLVQRLVKEKIPLTVCPLSNEKLMVRARFFEGKNPTNKLLDEGLIVTLNSDDPAFFGGYITDNFLKTAADGLLNEKDICKVCRNAFNASFLTEAEKTFFLKKIDHFNVAMGYAAPPKSITFFGSRRPTQGSVEYDGCTSTAKLFASQGFRIVNGGYNGLMEAASRGGNEGAKMCENDTPPKGVVGVLAPRVFSGRHTTGNKFLTHPLIARSISDRLERLVDSSEYFYVSGGTIGTITELMITWNAATVRPMFGGLPQRIYLLRSFWESTLETLVAATGVYPEDKNLLTFVDTEEEVLKLVEEDMKQREASATLTPHPSIQH